MFYWFMKNIVVGPFLLAVFRPWVVGLRERAQGRRRSCFASNHLSFIDSIFLPLVVDRPIIFLAKSEYFTGKGLKGWATRSLLPGRGQLPIDRSGGKASEASLETRSRVLGEGGTSASTPRAPAAPTAGCTAVAPASPAWSSKPACPVHAGRDDRHREGHADRHAAAEGAPHRHHLRRAARLLPLRGARGGPLRVALRDRRDRVRAPHLSGQEYVDVYASSVQGAARHASAVGSNAAAARRAAPRSPFSGAYAPEPSGHPRGTLVEPVVKADPSVIDGLDYWRTLPIKQQPQWPDAEAAPRHPPRSRRCRRSSSPARSTCCATRLAAAVARRGVPAAGRRLRRDLRRGDRRPDPQPREDGAADGGRAHLRRLDARREDGPDGGAVREAPLERHRDPRRRHAARLPRRHRQRLRLHARVARGRPALASCAATTWPPRR